MSGEPVPAVIPPAGRPSSLRRGRGEAAPLPLAVPPDRPGAVYGLGRLDASGRVTDRAVLAAPRQRRGRDCACAAVPGDPGGGAAALRAGGG
ncbi:MAG TPA: hypothetical protein VGG25_26960 [Streptosporangiaceae bacterium]